MLNQSPKALRAGETLSTFLRKAPPSFPNATRPRAPFQGASSTADGVHGLTFTATFQSTAIAGVRMATFGQALPFGRLKGLSR